MQIGEDGPETGDLGLDSRRGASAEYRRGPIPRATIPPRRQPDPDRGLGAHPERTAIRQLVCPHSWSCQLLVGRSPEICGRISVVSLAWGPSARMAVSQIVDEFVQLLSSVLLGLTLVQPFLRLRRPRPPLRDLVRQSGFVVCLAVIVGTLIVVDSRMGRADRRRLGSDPGLRPTLVLAGPRATPLAFGSELDRSPRPGRGMGLDRRNRQRDGLDRSLNQSNRLNRRDGGTDRDDHGIDHCHV